MTPWWERAGSARCGRFWWPCVSCRMSSRPWRAQATPVPRRGALQKAPRSVSRPAVGNLWKSICLHRDPRSQFTIPDPPLENQPLRNAGERGSSKRRKRGRTRRGERWSVVRPEGCLAKRRRTTRAEQHPRPRRLRCSREPTFVSSASEERKRKRPLWFNAGEARGYGRDGRPRPRQVPQGGHAGERGGRIHGPPSNQP